MMVSQQATKAHLAAGILLVLLSLGGLIASLLIQRPLFPILIFVFGVWGGVELGRYLEHWLSLRG
jgi:hypothetical protein